MNGCFGKIGWSIELGRRRRWVRRCYLSHAQPFLGLDYSHVMQYSSLAFYVGLKFLLAISVIKVETLDTNKPEL